MQDSIFNRSSCSNATVPTTRALALTMAKEYLAASTDLLKTLVFRTYTLNRCSGFYNPLFSGDGFTYTGGLRVLSCARELLGK